jgi:hypothetical protein
MGRLGKSDHTPILGELGIPVEKATVTQNGLKLGGKFKRKDH